MNKRYTLYAYRTTVEECEVDATSLKHALELAASAEASWEQVEVLKLDEPHLVEVDGQAIDLDSEDITNILEEEASP